MSSVDLRDSARSVGGAILAACLLLIAALFLFWPGPLAVTDRLPLALLFGLAGVAVGLRVGPTLRAALG